MPQENKSLQYIFDIEGNALQLMHIDHFEYRVCQNKFFIDAYMGGECFAIFDINRLVIGDPEEFFEKFLEYINSCDTQVITQKGYLGF
ncbi:MAG: hypothetical protein ACLFUW_00345 [Bacteroidales bacterium]